ncbi:MAG: glycosyltransferase family 4 protein [Patescibacteria group bacterium]
MREKGKIKVCFVSPFAYPLFNPKTDLKFGGAEVQMYLVATELAKDENFDVNFVVLDLGQERKEEYNGVRVYKAYKRGRSFFNLVRAPLKLIATLSKICPDVVISRAAGVEVGFSCLYTKIFRKKLIYSIAHDRDVNRSFFQGLRGRIFKFGFEHANCYIAQSQKQVDILEKTYDRKFNNIQVIPNSFYLEDKDSGPKESILWVGSSIDFKRPEIFADLAEEFPEERFVMIMTKSKAAPEKWKKIEQRAKDIDNLELIEQIPFKEIDDYFARAKVFVNTSTAEGFPNTFLQAMIVKTPILSLNVDPDGFIEKNKCGFSCRDSIEELQLKLKQLLENKEMRERMGENGYEHITKNHDINKNIQEWKRIIEKI